MPRDGLLSLIWHRPRHGDHQCRWLFLIRDTDRYLNRHLDTYWNNRIIRDRDHRHFTILTLRTSQPSIELKRALINQPLYHTFQISTTFRLTFAILTINTTA